ncbi:hypothetical protein [Burkholderia glumae]|uniref:hypothetical protein n=1 Tax=Burkholderia glumae TaxID=337 RepID=UPI0012D2E4A6|nr:hypothetical protein [Burkholderia glumae]MCM2481441.1 hypothetical protein [Burkholderia glumae]MCM2508419.1 hypothetical protein [Burkholderia glumae]
MNKIRSTKVSVNAKTLSEKSKVSPPNRHLLRIEKKKLRTSGSAFVALTAQRDDAEVSGATKSLGGKSLSELQSKYKKFLQIVK